MRDRLRERERAREKKWSRTGEERGQRGLAAGGGVVACKAVALAWLAIGDS